MKKTILFFLLFILCQNTFADIPPVERESYWKIMTRAQQEIGARVDFANKHGVILIPTSNRKTFSLFWSPAANSEQIKNYPTLVTLGGHHTYAYDDFFVWYEYAKKYQFNLVAIQWWIGQGETVQDYLSPEDITVIIREVLASHTISTHNNILHGFSRGSANIYAVAAIDHTGPQYFSHIIANAGKASQGFPPNKDINSGRFGTQPFAGTKWILFCGMKDENPDRDGCTGMTETESWVKKFGGQIELFIKDANAGHGGFHMNHANVESALKKIFSSQ